MQLNTIFKRKIILNSQKFNYWMWAKVWLTIPSRRLYCSGIGFLTLDVHDLQSFSDTLKVGLMVFLELSSERIPWVELGIGVKHVPFLELSLEWHPLSWAWDGGWTRGTLELSSGWRVLLVWVCWLWPVWMGPDRLPSSAIN